MAFFSTSRMSYDSNFLVAGVFIFIELKTFWALDGYLKATVSSLISPLSIALTHPSFLTWILEGSSIISKIVEAVFLTLETMRAYNIFIPASRATINKMYTPI